MKQMLRLKHNLTTVTLIIFMLFPLWGNGQIVWANIQWPPNSTINLGGRMAVFAQVYAPGVTDAAGQGAGITAWIGYNSTEGNSNPTTWTHWVPAQYNLMAATGNNDEYMADLGPDIPGQGTYFYASRFQLGTSGYVYGCLNGMWQGFPGDLGVLTVGPPPQIHWCNLQSPANGTITLGDVFNVNALVYEPGITDFPGMGTGITAEIGYSTANANPGTWTNWVPAHWSNDAGNGQPLPSYDVYTADIGTVITTPATYYYASRFKMGTADYVYGGINGGFWDGTGNVSGILTVNAPPVAYTVTGNGSYCASGTGFAVGLDGSQTGVTYTLFKNGVAQTPTFAGNGSAVTFGYQTAGTYTVSAANTGGTTPMTGSVVVTENPSLPASVSVESSANNVCSGTEVSFTAAPVHGGTPGYQWFLNNSPVGSNSATYTYVPLHDDRIYVRMTSDLACSTGNPANSSITTMIVKNSTAPVISRIGNTLSSDSPAGNQWYKDGVLITGANASNFAVTLNGTYTDIVTLNGCSSIPSAGFVFVYDAIGNPTAEQFEVFPIPSNGLFSATLACSSVQQFTIRVYNNVGSLVYEKKDIRVNESARQTIDIRHFPSGLYTVVFTSRNGQVIRKMIVQRPF